MMRCAYTRSYAVTAAAFERSYNCSSRRPKCSPSFVVCLSAPNLFFPARTLCLGGCDIGRRRLL
ncbi:hypothetical protein BD626DRAFT_504537, partial [Schizophyllum amplum]